MAKIACIVGLLMALLALGACGTNVRGCGGYPSPDWVDFNGCRDQPCTLKRGTVGTTKITFRAPFNASNFKPVIKGSYWGISQTHDLDPKYNNGCAHLTSDSQCPLEKGKLYTFVVSERVKSDEWALNGININYKLEDHNGYVLTCFEVKVNIK